MADLNCLVVLFGGTYATCVFLNFVYDVLFLFLNIKLSGKAGLAGCYLKESG